MLHLFLSYCKSHIYELHAVLAATIAFCLMFPIKKPLKQKIDIWIYQKASQDENWEKNRRLYRKRCNMVILVIAFVLTGVIFCIISLVSPLIRFSWNTTWLSGVFALTEYAVYDQLFGKEKER